MENGGEMDNGGERPGQGEERGMGSVDNYRYDWCVLQQQKQGKKHTRMYNKIWVK